MQRLITVLKLFLLLLVIYALLRVSFGLKYYTSNEISFNDWTRILYWGLRLDFSGLFYINLLFLVFYFFATRFFRRTLQDRLSLILFAAINIPFLALNFIDLVYFHFNMRRSTVDIIYSLPASMHSFGGLVQDYWLLMLSFILVSVAFILAAKFIFYRRKQEGRNKKYLQFVLPTLFIFFSVLVARGISSRPIIPSTPLLYLRPNLQPLVNNSTFNFLYSFKRYKTALARKSFFTPSSLDSIFSIRKQYPQSIPFQKTNVVIFVLESFAEQFFTDSNYRARTPFLDSIRNSSLVLTNAFQNGHESVKGIVSILASMPAFTEEPMFISNYSAIPFDGIGTILKRQGYSTHFFLGAEYDHFNFAKLCRMTGIDEYHSKEAVKIKDADDGNWGLYDEYFFPHFAESTGSLKQPFFSVLYNLSSHPPFHLPAHRRKQFDIPGQSAQKNSISYVDYCFSLLFDKMKNEPWFKNSVFVFIADHSLLEDKDRRSWIYESMRIPFFIYDPNNPVGHKDSSVVQQMDVVPSILDMLHYDQPFMSFGNSVFRSSEKFSVAKGNGFYQLIDSTYLTGIDDASGSMVYQFDRIKDPEMHNKFPPSGISHPAILLRAILQRFNNSLIDGNLKP